MAKTRKKQVSGRVAGLLFFVLLLLCTLNLLPPSIMKHLTNLHKILLYLVIFILPMLIYIKTNRYKISNALNLHHVKVKYLPFIILFGISTSVICMLINMGSLAILENFGIQKLPTSTVNFVSPTPAVTILTSIIMPAVCEELLIRGVALTEYGKYGVAVSVFITSLVFSLFHGSVVNLVSLFVAGIFYAVITYLFKSVWPAIFCHAINNALAVYINHNLEYIKYLFDDTIFVIILIAAVFVILLITLKLTENVVDELGNKGRLKTSARSLVYGEPLSSAYIWLFFILSVIICLKNFGIW
jgi:membrane protease YdiL (CAAX protease family)